MKCSDCSKHVTSRLINGLCETCYRYYRNGGIVYPLPPKGVIARDKKGRVICHICGKSFRNLGGHVRQRHSMCIDKYREVYGLNRRSKLTEIDYSTVMHNYALLYGMDDQLRTVGIPTRIKKGDKLRKGKPDRLQNILAKRERMSKK